MNKILMGSHKRLLLMMIMMTMTMMMMKLAKTLVAKQKKRTKARVIRSVWFNKEVEPEKHNCELIMLFTPWRNEETDLHCTWYKIIFFV